MTQPFATSGQAFDAWWDANAKQYSADACHMSEYHMAKVAWDAARSEIAANPLLSHSCGENMVCKVCGSLPVSATRQMTVPDRMIERIGELHGVYCFPDDLELFWERVNEPL